MLSYRSYSICFSLISGHHWPRKTYATTGLPAKTGSGTAKRPFTRAMIALIHLTGFGNSVGKDPVGIIFVNTTTDFFSCSRAWCYRSYTMAAKPIKYLELHYTTDPFAVVAELPGFWLEARLPVTLF